MRRQLGVIMTSRFIITAASTLLLSSLADAAEIKVLSTQATEEAYRELVPQFERATGHRLVNQFDLPPALIKKVDKIDAPLRLLPPRRTPSRTSRRRSPGSRSPSPRTAALSGMSMSSCAVNDGKKRIKDTLWS